MFSTPYKTDRYRTPPEQNSGITKVERAGYISSQKRIESMIQAGQRLSDYRKQQFDFPDGEIVEDYQDPTRSPNFDLSDATQMQLAAEARLKASQTAQEASRTIPEDNPVKTPVPTE